MVQYGVAARKIQKANKEASVNLYVSKEKAIRYLQVTPEEFRKLCILKGIFPRLPATQFLGPNTQYYFKKDITHLGRDPVLQTMRQIHTYHHKQRRFTYLRDEHALKFLELKKPIYNYQQLVKDRYPTPDAAIADLDDCLSMVALYAIFPRRQSDRCKTLIQQFNSYAAAMQALRKAFISTKGYYFQFIINNQLVTYLMPHKFNVDVPDDVEFDVLDVFVDFYVELLKFVLIWLFKQINIDYPIKAHEQQFDGIVAKTQCLQDAIQDYQFKQTSLQQMVFSNQVFYLSREVPRDAFELIILSGGGRVLSSACTDFTTGEATHLIVDRNQFQDVPGKEVVQPQYVVDSFNLGVNLPVSEYRLGQPLPAHLSPFQFDFTSDNQQNDQIKYIPERLTQLINYYKQFVMQVKPEVIETIASDQSVAERKLLGIEVKLPNAEQELESSEEQVQTNFDYDEQIKKDLEMDPKVRRQVGMLSGRKRRVYNEIKEKETKFKQQRDELLRKRRGMK